MKNQHPEAVENNRNDDVAEASPPHQVVIVGVQEEMEPGASLGSAGLACTCLACTCQACTGVGPEKDQWVLGFWT